MLKTDYFLMKDHGNLMDLVTVYKRQLENMSGRTYEEEVR